MKYLALTCEQKKCLVLKMLPTVLALFTAQVQKQKEKKNTKYFESFSIPYQWKTNSLHIIVKFGVKIDLFSDISLFYRINAFIVFVQIWSFFLIYSYPSTHQIVTRCCLLNFDVCLKCTRLFPLEVRQRTDFLTQQRAENWGGGCSLLRSGQQSRSPPCPVSVITFSFSWREKFYKLWSVYLRSWCSLRLQTIWLYEECP